MAAAESINRQIMQHLFNLEERVRLSGATLPKTDDIREKWSGLKCSIAQVNCILRLDDVAEILEDRTLTSIPGCLSWVKGVINLRGRLLPVFGVNEYFNKENTGSVSHQIVVIDRRSLFCGLLVSRMAGMRKFYTDSFSQFENTEDQACDGMEDYVEAITLIDGCHWYQLDIEKLARKIVETSPAVASDSILIR